VKVEVRMNINVGKVAVLFIVWAFFIGMVGLGVTVPTLLLIIGSILYLLT
jgi:hypothetical protein